MDTVVEVEENSRDIRMSWDIKMLNVVIEEKFIENKFEVKIGNYGEMLCVRGDLEKKMSEEWNINRN